MGSLQVEVARHEVDLALELNLHLGTRVAADVDANDRVAAVVEEADLVLCREAGLADELQTGDVRQVQLVTFRLAEVRNDVTIAGTDAGLTQIEDEAVGTGATGQRVDAFTAPQKVGTAAAVQVSPSSPQR